MIYATIPAVVMNGKGGNAMPKKLPESAPTASQFIDMVYRLRTERNVKAAKAYVYELHRELFRQDPPEGEKFTYTRNRVYYRLRMESDAPPPAKIRRQYMALVGLGGPGLTDDELDLMDLGNKSIGDPKFVTSASTASKGGSKMTTKRTRKAKQTKGANRVKAKRRQAREAQEERQERAQQARKKARRQTQEEETPSKGTKERRLQRKRQTEGRERRTSRTLRPRLFGHSVSGFFRWMGAEDYTLDDARVLLSHMDMEVNPSTVSTSMSDGRGGLGSPPPELTDEEIQEVEAALDAAWDAYDAAHPQEDEEEPEPTEEELEEDEEEEEGDIEDEDEEEWEEEDEDEEELEEEPEPLPIPSKPKRMTRKPTPKPTPKPKAKPKPKPKPKAKASPKKAAPPKAKAKAKAKPKAARKPARSAKKK